MHVYLPYAGNVTVLVSKSNHGEHFPNLEMLTTLLPHQKKDLKELGKKPLIEVLEPEGACGEGAVAVGGVEEEEEEEFDWQIQQTLPDKVFVVAKKWSLLFLPPPHTRTLHY